MLLRKKSNKTKAVKFLLTPRPQKDPLAADFDAPQHVLMPKGDVDLDKIKEELPDFDPKVFASKEETRTGMLERAHNADGITFDSDILEAMSKDFDYEDPNNILDEDFVDQAGGLIEDEGELLEGEMIDLTDGLFEDEPEVIRFNNPEGDEDNSEDEFYDNREDDDDDDNYDKEEVFTKYSMTSSVMRRNEGLQQIDEHFERLYEKEYANDTEIGPLDLNDVKGEELLTNIDQIRQLKREVKTVRKRNHGDDYEPEIVSDHHKNAIIGDNPVEDDLVEVEVRRRENRVDCESILSYNSNLYNHPKLIIEPRKKANKSSSDQMDVESSVDNRSRSGHGGQSIASSRATVLSKLSIRPSNETPEERKNRKKALKEYRHSRRQERKQNQTIFKAEQANLVKQLRTNMHGLKLA